MVRSSDPTTSQDAAIAATPKLALNQQMLVMGALAALGHGGAEDVARWCQLEPYAVRKRLPELQRQGLVRPTGTTVTTSSGRQERVWEPVHATAP